MLVMSRNGQSVGMPAGQPLIDHGEMVSFCYGRLRTGMVFLGLGSLLVRLGPAVR